MDCTNLARPRLISPTKDHGEYLALSYVWGNSEQAHQTTTSNVSAYERGINPRMLPQTLRDAIRVTHMLGFRSLWVDSLCILQDSPQDKAQEISGMHHIYRNAQLTIMAAGAQSVEAGFLCKRDPLYNDDQYIPDESNLPYQNMSLSPSSALHALRHLWGLGMTSPRRSCRSAKCSSLTRVLRSGDRTVPNSGACLRVLGACKSI